MKTANAFKVKRVLSILFGTLIIMTAVVVMGIANPGTVHAATVTYNVPAPSGGDDTSAIQSTIDTAVTYTNGHSNDSAKVQFGNGTYITSNTLNVIGNRILFQGNGATATLISKTNPLVGYLQITGDSNQINNIAFDHPNADLPNTQLTVAAVGSNYIDVDIDSGYPALDASWFTFYKPGGGCNNNSTDLIGYPLNSAGLYDTSYFFPILTNVNDTTSWRTHLSGSRWRLYNNQQVTFFVGQRLAFGLHYIGAGITFNSSNTTVQNVTMYSAGAAGLVGDLTGPATITNFKLIKNTGRLMTSTADGIHFNTGRGLFILQNSMLEATGDDAINNHDLAQYTSPSCGFQSALTKVSATQVSILDGNGKGPDELVGDAIEIYDGVTFNYKGTATVTAIASNTETLSAAIPGLATGDYLLNVTAGFPNAIYRNNTINNHRGRGILVRGVGTQITGNVFNSVPYGINMIVDPWLEGPPPRNTLIQSNTFNGTTDSHPTIWFQNTNNYPFTNNPTYGFQILNNTFNNMTTPAVDLTLSTNVIIDSNIMNAKTGYNNPINFINIGSSSGITVTNNTATWDPSLTNNTDIVHLNPAASNVTVTNLAINPTSSSANINTGVNVGNNASAIFVNNINGNFNAPQYLKTAATLNFNGFIVSPNEGPIGDSTSNNQASANFSSTQGQGQWFYKEWNGSSYVNMTWDAANNRWKGSYPFTLIANSWQHPDVNPSVRTWVANSAGMIMISGNPRKGDVTGGSGVIVSMLKNGTTIWGPYTIAYNDSIGIYHNIMTSVNSGDSIQFKVACNAGDCSYDQTTWDPSIINLESSTASAEFRSTQGQNPWTYQQLNGSLATGTTYTNMTTWDATNNRWQGSYPYTLIGNNWQHPDTYSSARTWTAPRTGMVQITGNPKKLLLNGNGVNVAIADGTAFIWGPYFIAGTDGIGLTHTINLYVQQGDQIHFVVDNNGDSGYDTTGWDPTITYHNSWQGSAGFSSVQGQNQWYYKEWNGSTYANMVWDSANSRWKGSYPYTLIGSYWQAPDSTDSVREWVAPRPGSININGIAKKATSGGDGVIVTILKGSTVLWGPTTISGTDTIGKPFNLTTNVIAGDQIYLRVNKNGDATFDTTILDPTISY